MLGSRWKEKVNEKYIFFSYSVVQAFARRNNSTIAILIQTREKHTPRIFLNYELIQEDADNDSPLFVHLGKNKF